MPSFSECVEVSLPAHRNTLLIFKALFGCGNQRLVLSLWGGRDNGKHWRVFLLKRWGICEAGTSCGYLDSHDDKTVLEITALTAVLVFYVKLTVFFALLHINAFIPCFQVTSNLPHNVLGHINASFPRHYLFLSFGHFAKQNTGKRRVRAIPADDWKSDCSEQLITSPTSRFFHLTLASEVAPLGRHCCEGQAKGYGGKLCGEPRYLRS